jgi:hypothetical protein
MNPLRGKEEVFAALDEFNQITDSTGFVKQEVIDSRTGQNGRS